MTDHPVPVAPALPPATDHIDTVNAIHDALAAKLIAGNKAVLFDTLAAAGVARVVVSFDGYGDSGQIERLDVEGAVVDLPAATVEIATPIWGEPEPKRQSMSLADAIEKLVYGFLEHSHWGWQDGDGAYGEFTFDVVARSITLDYNGRYVASDYSQHVF